MDGILSTDVDYKAGIRRKDIQIKKPASTPDLRNTSSQVVTPIGVQYRFRDINKDLVAAWREAFKDRENVQVCGCAIQVQGYQQRFGGCVERGV